MSSRALRRLQKEKELEKQLSAARGVGVDSHDPEDEEDEENEEDEAQPMASSRPSNVFDMLDVPDQDESEEEEEQGSTLQLKDSNKNNEPSSIPATPVKSKKKRKKQRKKAKEKTEETSSGMLKEPEMDDIDRALMELSMKDVESQPEPSSSRPPESPEMWESKATKLLAIDTKHLNPINEMKSLFGNIVIEGSSDSRSSPRNQRRRERAQNQQGGVDLATALTGRQSAASDFKELGTMASRRNPLMQGREEWPLATSGGLSMEHTPGPTFEKLYNIIHNEAYQETQQSFQRCVASMQPQTLINLLLRNPYHIATLLQVSEIAKHQGDHSLSGDLLERALYSFGRSVHSTFSVAIREGTVRISFAKSANRELYLTVWRYIKNLEMRGTWATAYEWAKMLLQFNTKSDPYGVTLMIDQLALRGRQHAALIELCSESGYGSSWRHLPNIQISLALAHQRSSQPKLARQQLAIALYKYPYVLSALASALDISPLPTFLRGKLPSTNPEKLYTELYVTRAKDLWSTPETTSLLVEVAETLDHYSENIKSSLAAPVLEISLEEARHIVLLEIPSLIALLPRHFTNMHTSSSDVLPPPEGLSEFTARAPARVSNAPASQRIINDVARGQGARVQQALNRIMEFILSGGDPREPDPADEAAVREAAASRLAEDHELRITPEMVQMLTQVARGDVTAESLGLPPETDLNEYYDMVMNVDDSNEDEESMPDIDSLPNEPGEDEVRNPRTATVEEDENPEMEVVDETSAQRNIGTALLRHVDSDDSDHDENDAMNTWRPSSSPPTLAPLPVPTPPTESATPSSQPNALNMNDPQRVQRWLLSTGLDELRADSGHRNLAGYVEKMRVLRKPLQEWVLNIVQQQAGKELAERITAAL